MREGLKAEGHLGQVWFSYSICTFYVFTTVQDKLAYQRSYCKLMFERVFMTFFTAVRVRRECKLK